ncbi:MAG: succinate dehydrogenase assembly factor 2 [Gammaproteobacteria bacterium]|nr:succinate dehydrogenase assembly factor 2 [Gammaproteobacteria bacterium]
MMSVDSRLAWQCRRGMLELDLLLRGFLDNGYEQLDASGRDAFERLLKTQDQTLFEYFMQNKLPKERELIDVIEQIRHAAQT